jgi:hypothetical protein
MPHPRLRSRLAVTLALLLGLGTRALAAQQTTVDEGSLLVTREGAPAAHEAFRLVRSGTGDRALYTASADVRQGDRRLTATLSADASGAALLYRVEVRRGTTLEERLQATARPGRLSVSLHTPERESAKEFVVPEGAHLVDDDLYHQLALLPLRGETATLAVLAPRAGTQQTGRLVRRGAEQIVVDGQRVTATRWALDRSGDPCDFWLDAAGRLLRVVRPARGVTAVREELPR